MAKPKRVKKQIDISDVEEDIERYAEICGIRPDVWAALSQTQKVKIIIRYNLQQLEESSDDE